MPMKIAGHDGAALHKTHIVNVKISVGGAGSGQPSQNAGSNAPAARTQNDPAPDTGQETSATLVKISRSRKFAENIDDVLGIQNLTANFYVDSRSDRRVVQLRESESRKMVRQVPTPEFLDRVAKTREFIGKNFDVKV